MGAVSPRRRLASLPRCRPGLGPAHPVLCQLARPPVTEKAAAVTAVTPTATAGGGTAAPPRPVPRKEQRNGAAITKVGGRTPTTAVMAAHFPQKTDRPWARPRRRQPKIVILPASATACSADLKNSGLIFLPDKLSHKTFFAVSGASLSIVPHKSNSRTSGPKL